MSNINVNNLTPLLGSGSSVSVSGSLVVKNDVTIGGHLYIGDQNTDSVTFSAEVSSSVIPDATITYDLGSASKKWSTIYLNSLVTHHITASGNISASGTGINGTGSFHHVAANGNITSSGTGSFEGGVIANNATGSFGYVSSSGAISFKWSIFIGNLIQQHTNGVTNFAVDALGQVTASGQISSSAGLAGTALTLATNGVNALTVSTAGALSASSTLAGTALELKTAGVHKASIDASGNIAAEGTISSSGLMSATALTLTTAGVHKASIDASGNVAAEGNISSSATLAARNLDIKTAGVTKATIDTSGNLDLIAGNEAGATGSFGYISSSGDFTASGNITASGVYADGDISASGAVFTKFIKPNVGATLNITPDTGAAFASDTHTVQIYGGLRAGSAITTAHTILGPTTIASLVDLTPTLETKTANFTAAVGREYIVNKADGAAIVLPAAYAGARVTILIGTLITSNTTTITAASGDLLKGYAFMEATDAANNKTHFVPDGSDDLIITLDGSTTGGLIGDRIELVGISATEWRVRATLSHTSTAATPFS